LPTHATCALVCRSVVVVYRKPYAFLCAHGAWRGLLCFAQAEYLAREGAKAFGSAETEVGLGFGRIVVSKID
jgi:hypothetical protein